jgi:hypothetical protein
LSPPATAALTEKPISSDLEWAGRSIAAMTRAEAGQYAKGFFTSPEWQNLSAEDQARGHLIFAALSRREAGAPGSAETPSAAPTPEATLILDTYVPRELGIDEALRPAVLESAKALGYADVHPGDMGQLLGEVKPIAMSAPMSRDELHGYRDWREAIARGVEVEEQLSAALRDALAREPGLHGNIRYWAWLAKLPDRLAAMRQERQRTQTPSAWAGQVAKETWQRGTR